MEWLPTEADFLTVFGAVLAAGAALLGLVTGLNQFSNAARARRLIEWTSAALTSEQNTNRRTALENLKLHGQGHLIAVHLMPWWHFSGTFLWTLLSSSSIIAILKELNVLFIISHLILLTLLVQNSIKFYIERVRIEHQFVIGNLNIDPIHPETLAWIRRGTKSEWILSFSFSFSTLITSGLIAGALTAGQGAGIWPWAVMGASACGICLMVIHFYAKVWARA